MSRGVNMVILVGHLGGPPEVRITQSGRQLVRFSVATDESFTDKDGEKQEQTEWHQVVAWGKLAWICQKYLAKGRQVYIKGALRTRSWETKDGANRRTSDIIAQEIVFLGSQNPGHND